MGYPKVYYIRMNKDPLTRQGSQCLIECEFMPEEEEHRFYFRVSWQDAHRWVKSGGHHETPLWWDGTRIRYAKDNS